MIVNTRLYITLQTLYEIFIGSDFLSKIKNSKFEDCIETE